jgi:hypothetical protein
MKQVRWVIALVVGALVLAACGTLQQATMDDVVTRLQTNISASVTTLPDPDTIVLDFGMVAIDANTSELEGCEFFYKLDAPVPPDAEATIGVEPDEVTFKVSGNKDDGYTVEIEGTIDGFPVVIDEVYFGVGNNARKFTFDPGVTYASPLPAPLGPTGGLADISHTFFCYSKVELFEELDVSKTVDTSFKRTHDWSIEKFVETENDYELDGVPKIWLYIDGSGDETATWYIDVTYEGFEDSDHHVSGEITIVNTGTLDAEITDIEDVLGGTTIDVDCGEDFELPYTLPVGETLTCTYVEDVDGEIEGNNVVTVTTERDVYDATEPIEWGEPDPELHAVVEVKDLSELFGLELLGTLDAAEYEKGAVIHFDYDKDFAYEDYGQEECGSFEYENTAEVVGDEDEVLDSADALLKVNVQCLIFQGDTAWAANGNVPLERRYTTRGNWATYVEYFGEEKTTTLFAGQTNAVGTVHFSAAVGGEVVITVELYAEVEFEDVAENLMVQDYATAPSGNPEPGLFDHKKYCDPAESSCDITVPENNFYGVHVNVGTWIPDPDFGP